jgi:hypothetical protein
MKHRIEQKTAGPLLAKRCVARGVAACSPGAFARASGSRRDVRGGRRDNHAPARRERRPCEGRRS